MAVIVIGSVVSMPLFVIAGAAMGERMAIGAVAIGFLGAAALGFAGIGWRAANPFGRAAGLNALMYAAPVLTLAWLFPLGHVGAARGGARRLSAFGRGAHRGREERIR